MNVKPWIFITESVSEFSPVGFWTWRANLVRLDTATLVPLLAAAGTVGRVWPPWPEPDPLKGTCKVCGVAGLSEADCSEGCREAGEGLGYTEGGENTLEGGDNTELGIVELVTVFMLDTTALGPPSDSPGTLSLVSPFTCFILFRKSHLGFCCWWCAVNFQFQNSHSSYIWWHNWPSYSYCWDRNEYFEAGIHFYKHEPGPMVVSANMFYKTKSENIKCIFWIWSNAAAALPTFLSLWKLQILLYRRSHNTKIRIYKNQVDK